MGGWEERLFRSNGHQKERNSREQPCQSTTLPPTGSVEICPAMMHFSLGGKVVLRHSSFSNTLSYFCAADVKTRLLCPLFPYFLHKQIHVRYNLLIKILQVSSFDSERTEFLSPFSELLFQHFSRASQGDIKLSLFGLAHHSSSRSHMQRERVSFLYLFLDQLPTRHGELTARRRYITATQPSNKA